MKSGNLFQPKDLSRGHPARIHPVNLNNDFLDNELNEESAFQRGVISPLPPSITPLMIDNLTSGKFSSALEGYISLLDEKISEAKEENTLEPLNRLKLILLYVLDKEHQNNPLPERARSASVELLPITLEQRSMEEAGNDPIKQIDKLQTQIDELKIKQKNPKTTPEESKTISAQIKTLIKNIKNHQKKMTEEKNEYSFSLLNKVFQKKPHLVSFKSDDPTLYFDEGEEVRTLATQFMDTFFSIDENCTYINEKMNRTAKEENQAANISFYLTEITLDDKTHKICYFSGSAALVDPKFGCKDQLSNTANTLNSDEKMEHAPYVFVDHYSPRFKSLLQIQKQLNQEAVRTLLKDTFANSMSEEDCERILETLRADLFLAKTTVKTCAEMPLISQLAKTLAFYNKKYSPQSLSIQVTAVNLHFYPYGKKGFDHNIAQGDVLGELPSAKEDGCHYKTRTCCATCQSYKPLFFSMMQSDTELSPMPSPVLKCLRGAGLFGTGADQSTATLTTETTASATQIITHG